MSDSPPQKPRARVRKKALLSFTKLTAPKPVTKQLRLSADGKLEKSSTAQRLTTAAIERVTCDATGFLNALRTVNPTDCFVYGTPKSSSADRIVTVQQHEQDGQPENCIPRTNEAFQWPEGPGIMMLDYDPDQSTLSPDELRKALYAACPEMEQSAHVWAASASSCIFHAQTGHELGGIKGQRIYVLVTDAQDIPRAARVLHQRLWLNGHGYIKISKAGALLERSLIDQSVFQPSRIDFTAPAQCESPLVQRKPPAHLHGDAKKTLATASALPDLTPDELAKYEQLVRQAKEQKKPEAEQLRATYIEARIHELEARGVGSAEAQQTMRDAFEHNVLHGDFLLHTENGQTVTVSELLKDKTRWHGTRFCDPLEPDYVLFMLFIKYITDKYGNSDDFEPPVSIPKGASFNDMIALKGKSDIGEKISAFSKLGARTRQNSPPCTTTHTTTSRGKARSCWRHWWRRTTQIPAAALWGAGADSGWRGPRDRAPDRLGAP